MHTEIKSCLLHKDILSITEIKLKERKPEWLLLKPMEEIGARDINRAMEFLSLHFTFPGPSSSRGSRDINIYSGP